MDYLEFYRKQSVIFGIPSMETVDETFKNKLLLLKTNIEFLVQIQFLEEETKTIYSL
jgi:hypothetical protein